MFDDVELTLFCASFATRSSLPRLANRSETAKVLRIVCVIFQADIFSQFRLFNENDIGRLLNITEK